ncbi:MAG: hypothetical protein J0H85_11550 [Sediminibacterium magnilacihabitans]|jgi:hypothetical protein|nr:hypothetical protein [Sediminibacterium magnilacihabitans]PQV60897.1 hypothetical protein CLV53_105163 [Sediminibacterium magnilacihabitans]
MLKILVGLVLNYCLLPVNKGVIGVPVTINTDHKVEVNNGIKEEFENGKEYHCFHDNNLFLILPREADMQGEKYIEWHNQNVFKG